MITIIIILIIYSIILFLIFTLYAVMLRMLASSPLLSVPFLLVILYCNYYFYIVIILTFLYTFMLFGIIVNTFIFICR